MRKLIIIFVVLLVLGGGGAAAWFFYFSKTMGEQAEDEEEVVEPEPEGPPVYVEFNPMQFPVLGEDGVEQMVTLVIALQVPDDSAGDEVIAMAPRLNDAFMVQLYGALDARTVMLSNGMIDVTSLKVRLVEAADGVLGTGVVQDALVQMISQRQL